MVYKLFNKKSASLVAKSTFGARNTFGVRNKIISNKELVKDLHKPISRKFERRELHSPLIDNIWATDIADTQLISKLNKEFRFLLCTTDIYSMGYSFKR